MIAARSCSEDGETALCFDPGGSGGLGEAGAGGFGGDGGAALDWGGSAGFGWSVAVAGCSVTFGRGSAGFG
jgi:hypothetical protein